MLNKCTFIGNMGKDPEIRTLQNGKMVASFSLAVTESWKDKNTGEKKSSTEWINCATFTAAKVIQNYTGKGSKLYVEGKYKLEKYTDKDGNEKQSPKFVIQSVQLLDSKPQTQQTHQGYGQQPSFQAPLDDNVIPF